MKLGRLPYRHDPRTLHLANYVNFGALLPNIPPAWNWDTDVATWPMYLNDRIGDCTCAEVGHHVQLLTAANGHQVDVRDTDVLKLYEKVSGYNPTSGANDNGAVILDVLDAWRHDGIAGHKVSAFVEVDVSNRALLEAAIYLFGGLSIGLALPIAAQKMGRYWRKPRTTTGDGAPGSWGGHCVYVADFNRSGVTVVTWGELTHVTWAFWREYVEEAWAVLSPDWVHDGKSPQGFDLTALQSDLADLGKVS